MSTNPYYQEAFAGSAGQIARAEQVKNEFDGVQSGFDAVYAAVLATVQGQPAETLTPLPAAASRANKWLRFDASGQPYVVTSPMNPRGAWAANTAYAVGDVFTAAPNGSLYYVATAYTSGATFGSTDLANTSLLVNLASLYFSTPSIVAGPATVAAAAGNNYGLDSSLGNITVNLPNAAIGDSPVSLTYLGGAASTVTVNSASGQFIDGNTQTSLVMDVTGFSTSLQYWGASYGWRVRTMG